MEPDRGPSKPDSTAGLDDRSDHARGRIGVAVAVVAVLASACGGVGNDDTGSSGSTGATGAIGIEHPTGADQLILRWPTRGFVPYEYTLGEHPVLVPVRGWGR